MILRIRRLFLDCVSSFCPFMLVYQLFLSILDSSVPIVICLVIEKGLSVVSSKFVNKRFFKLQVNFLFQEIIAENAGRFAHVFNLIVLVMIPIVVIHLRGSMFSLSELFLGKATDNFLKFNNYFLYSRIYVCVLPLLNTLYETLVLRSSQPLVSMLSKTAKKFNFWKAS